MAKRKIDRTPPALSALLPSWQRSLDERGLSPRTQEVYQRTAIQLCRWLAGRGEDSVEVSAASLREWLAAEAARTSAISAHQHYRNLKVMFKWLVREGELAGPSPMERVDPPVTTVKVKATLPEDALRKLLRGCEGQDFESRRDMAIIRVLIDTGMRVSGLGNARLADVDLTRHVIKIVLKGGSEHLAPIGRRTTAALDRYLRSRTRHPRADSDWLWLGMSGKDTSHFGAAGIQDMVERRGKLAGLGKISPHAFRRTFAHSMLLAGASDMDIARIAGWKSTAMVAHYAGELAIDRARETHARLSPGDQL